MSEIEIRQSILDAGRRLYDRNMLAAADGNISVRLSDQRILITPSGLAKGFLALDQLAVIDIDDKIIAGQPSSERLMHLEIYRSSPLAKAVVHAHPPHAIAWSVVTPAVQELPSEVLSEVILATGRIPIVPYARPTTAAMGTQLRKFLPKHRAMILQRHGAVTWGESLAEAVHGMERVEHSAQILWLAKTLGKLKPMPASEVRELRRMRQKMGDKLL